MIRAILFDAYGTLFDTGTGSITATAAILRKCQSNLAASDVYVRWKQIHKSNIRNLSAFVPESEIFVLDLKQLSSEFGIAVNPEEDVKPMLASLRVRTVFPEVDGVIEQLRRQYKLYIASTTDTEPLESDIRRNEVVVEHFFTSESLRLYKPREEFYQRILDSIECLPTEVLFVGDSPDDDVIGPKSLGIASVWLNREGLEWPSTYTTPDYQISSLEQLPNILEQLG